MTAIVAIDTDNISVSYASADPDTHRDLDQAISDLHELRETVTALRMWEGVLTDWIADALGRNTLDLDGIGHIEVKHGANRKEWDRRALVRAVLDSRMPPHPDTGEMDPNDDGRAEVDGEAISVSPDLGRVLHVWNLGAPRVTALRERGIDPDEFCQATPGKTSVVFT